MGGEAELTNDAFSGLKTVLLVAIIGIWMIIALLFGSLFQPLLVMIIIPFAIAAAMLALMLPLISKEGTSVKVQLNPILI